MDVAIEKKIIPKLRFNKFNEKWNRLPIGDLLAIKSGYGFKANEYSSSGIRLLQIENVSYGKIKWNTNMIFLPESYLLKYRELHLKINDIVIALNRPVTNNQLKISKISSADEPCILYQRVGKLVFFDTNTNSDFIYQLFRKDVKRFVLTKSIGSDQPFISIKALYKFKINIPTFSEQQKIASFLSAVDKKIEQLTQKKTLLETYKKGVMQQLFSQEIRFKQDDSSNYSDWEEKKLGEVCNFFSGGTPSSTNRKYYSGDIPFIGSGNISDNNVEQFITIEALTNSSAKLVKRGDLLYALYGATSGEVSISKIDGAINQAVLCIRSNESNIFLLNILSFNKQKIISKFLQGGQGNLSAKIVKQLKYNLPCIEEQQKIASFLRIIDKKIELVDTQLEQTKIFKKGLLQQMFV